MADAIEAAADQNRLRSDHLLHLRCEVASADVLEHFEDFETDPRVRLISLMDHSRASASSSRWTSIFSIIRRSAV